MPKLTYYRLSDPNGELGRLGGADVPNGLFRRLAETASVMTHSRIAERVLA